MDTIKEGESAFRVLEFYCGIGGLRYSLEKSGVKAVVIEAFDINEVANDVYEHNFGHRPSQGNIQGLSAKQLDKYRADAWVMSPPCQPYTRQGLQQDADDARAFSFLRMLQMLPLMDFPPSHVLVENVVGFENSVTHGRLMAELENAGLVTQEFILSPLQFGIPYSRPRYFCLAKRSSDNFVQKEYNGQLLCHPGPLLHFEETGTSSATASGIVKEYAEFGGSRSNDDRQQIVSSSSSTHQNLSSTIQSGRNEPILNPAVQCSLVQDYLEPVPAHAREESASSQISEPCSSQGRISLQKANEVQMCEDHGVESPRQDRVRISDQCIPDGKEGAPSILADLWEPYKVPALVVDRWVDAYDVVTPYSRRCCCFTKSYTRYAKGTGSFLAANYRLPVSGGTEDSLMKHISDLRLQGRSLTILGLRYFTPREVANLHSFPDTFRFPAHVRLKQRYALLGNSLSIAVVSNLLKYLFAAPTSRAAAGVGT